MVVVANKPGQLGNRLFVFAHLIALGLSAGVPVANPAFDEYAGMFRGTARDPLCRYPPRSAPSVPTRIRVFVFHAARALAALVARVPLPGIEVVRIGWEETFDLSDPHFASDVRRRRVTFLQGWLFRHEQGVDRFREEIRAHLRPIPAIEQAVARLVAEARAGADLLVGVHVRRGDYAALHDGAYYFELEDYRELIRDFHRRLPPGRTVAFLVCSDEAIGEAAFRGAAERLSVSSGTAVEDLYALASCDLLMGPPSTFSMWASYYGGVPLHIVRDPARAPDPGAFEVFRMEGYPTSVRADGPTYW